MTSKLKSHFYYTSAMQDRENLLTLQGTLSNTHKKRSKIWNGMDFNRDTRVFKSKDVN